MTARMLRVDSFVDMYAAENAETFMLINCKIYLRIVTITVFTVMTTLGQCSEAFYTKTRLKYTEESTEKTTDGTV